MVDEIKVILIEDHDLTRVGMRSSLQQYSEFQVVGEAANGRTGLSLLEELEPDLAIVDIGLPDLDGIEVTRQFKHFQAESGSTHTKILILTLHDHEQTVLAAFAAGADSYCMKDINFNTLVEVIRLTHEGNCWIDPAIARVVLQQARKLPRVEPGTEGLNTGETNDKAATDAALQAYQLTERELEVLQLIVEGCSNAIIAERLFITVGTVKTHVRNILNKLCADDRTQAAVLALRAGLVG
jgi:DNA-binding NarL/FixJ family response regulator